MDIPGQKLESFLPALQNNHNSTYTLVLDLDETLIHSTGNPESPDQCKLSIRPGAIEFLIEMAKSYELVIFTAGTKDYADWALNYVDPNKLIAHKLYREHAILKGLAIIKDISRLGRDLKKVIIIDNIAENFQLQQENGIFINTWEGDPEDDTLSKLAPILKEIVSKKVEDVRVALRHYRDFQMRAMLKTI